MSIAVQLLPAQQQALDKLERHVRAHHVTSLMGRPGAGKTSIAQMARDSGKWLVFASEGIRVPGVFERVPHAQIPPFDMADYAPLCTTGLPAERVGALDVRKIHRFAPNLSAPQLRNMLVGLEGADEGLGAAGLSHVVFGPGTAFGSGSASGG